MNMMSKQFDRHSIKFRLCVTFLGFALILLALLWCLQLIFLSGFYENSKKAESNTLITQIQSKFWQMDATSETLSELIDECVSPYNISIFVWDENRHKYIYTREIDTMSRGRGMYVNYSQEIAELDLRLSSSSLNSSVNLATTKSGARIMESAWILSGRSPNAIYTIYMFSPLTLEEATLDILRKQLLWSSLIAILLAFLLSLYLANRISKPIRKITTSAAEMGKGNYNVKFHGGQFSEIQALAVTLTHTEHELEKTDMYQKDLIANVSHDLRTPLTMIKSYAEMIRDLSGDNPEKRDKHLGVIIQETDRLNTLVTDMLNLSRMQSRSIRLAVSDFDFSQTIDAIMPSFQILTENEGYDIRFTSSGAPFFVQGDEAKIKQVISNLISNAVKYCGEDKQILIDVRRIGRRVRFSVTDHGKGIAPDELPHVWERYYKSSTNHVRTTEGSGLGLSIVKEILQLHKADFDVSSTLNEGSTFWFELPLVKSPKAKA